MLFNGLLPSNTAINSGYVNYTGVKMYERRNNRSRRANRTTSSRQNLRTIEMLTRTPQLQETSVNL